MIKTVSLGKSQILATAQAMYEIEGRPLREIAEIFKVNKNSVTKWKKKGQWMARKSSLPEVKEITRKKFLEAMSEQGMPPERAAALLIEGMTKPMTDQILEPGEKGQEPKVLFEGNPDYKARQKHLHDYLVLAGFIGNNGGLNITGGAEGTVNIQVNIPEKGEGK